jgi:hypothetical protein
MAWIKSTVNGYATAYEDLTLPTGASTDTETSPIDFIPRGAKFTVFMNVLATDLASAAPTDVYVDCGNLGWIIHLADFLATCDNVQVVGVWDGRLTATHITAPRYQLRLDHGGNQTGEVVRVQLVWEQEHDDNKRY